MIRTLRQSMWYCLAVLPAIAASGCAAASLVRDNQGRPIATQMPSTSDSIQWITVNTDSGVLRAAIARPTGPGPFPTVIILHGTHGFGQEYVKLAKDLSQRGVLAVAACWFEGAHGTAARFVTPIACDGAPRFIDAEGRGRFKLSRQTVHALVNSIKEMPDVRAVALFGHSRGGGAALDYALQTPGAVSALILNSTGYPPEVTNDAATLSVPVLIMHGVDDNPADGGSAFTRIEMARGFESALKRARKTVETRYFEHGGHNSLFTSSTQYADALQRMSAFLHRVLR